MSRPSGRVRFRAETVRTEKTSDVATIGSTMTSEPLESAAACRAKPSTSKKMPSTQRGRLNSLTSSPSRTDSLSGILLASRNCRATPQP